MGSTDFSLRQFQPEDGPAYATLLAASPDIGSIGMVERFEIDPYQALVGVHDEAFCVVASGQVEWKTLPEMHDAYVEWESRQ